MVARLRPVRRIGFPLYRRDIWFHILGSFPILTYVTYRSWSSWHPEVNRILSESCGYSLSPSSQQCPAIDSILDASSKLPTGVPLLYPSSAIPIELQEPLLASNNLFLMVCAAWVAGFVGVAICLLLPCWLSGYKFRVLYNDADSLTDADSLMICEDESRSAIFCPIKIGFRYGRNSEGSIDRRKVVPGPMVEYKSKTYLISTLAENPGRAKKYGTLNPALSSSPLCLLPPQYDTGRTFGEYSVISGFTMMTEIANASKVFGQNVQDIPIPDFSTLFLEHAVQPLFVFQIFSMLLWLLDEYWQYSMMTLGILIMFEGQMVYRRRTDLMQIKAMHSPPTPVLVKRCNKWYQLSSQDLLPGDVFSLSLSGTTSGDQASDTTPGKQNSATTSGTQHSRSKFLKWPGGSKIPKFSYGEDQSISIPCDALILTGSCVVNEAMLTGESLPQMKSGLNSVLTKSNSEVVYDMTSKHKAHTLYAGTGLLTQTGDDKFHGATLYCLRTGFQTTQGKLIRTVLHSSERRTGSSTEALLFLLILTVIAFLASGYVLFESWGLPNRNHYKLLLHCVIIITSVVPPELPVTMSLTVTTSVNALFKKKLFCTEPFRIPLAGKLTYCCFDKTGTLTTSDVLLEQVLSKNLKPITGSNAMAAGATTSADTTTSSQDLESSLVMGCCNSLIAIKKMSRLPAHMRVADGRKVEEEFSIVGDPLEKTAAAFVGWQPEIGRQDRFIETNKARYAEVIRRFPFASELQRMTCVITLQQERANPRYFVVCKGAAERIASLSKSVPPNFYEEVDKLALEGRRVLAMAYKEIHNQNDLQQILKSRETIEAHLNFAGLLIYGCPLKYKTKETIKVLKDSGHATVMITGDDFRTAAHIAKEVGMIRSDTEMWCLSAQTPLSSDTHHLALERLGAKKTATVELDSISTFLAAGKNGLVIVGNDLEVLSASARAQLIPLCNVFARVTPAQKEMILRCLKQVGESTLMCGDGTNDVGALKAADVGVSLLNFNLEKIKERKKEKSVKKICPSSSDADPCLSIVLEPVSVSRQRRLTLGLNARQIQHLENMENTFTKQKQQLDLLPLWWKNRTIPALYQNIVNTEERMAQNNLAAASSPGQKQAGGPGGLLASLLQPQGAAGNGVAEDFDDGQPLLRPGDASMASPFTYRGQSVKCIKLLIKMGKATLATVMMNYRLMALNSLTSAFSLSVLTLNGVKYGDAQITAESMFVAVLYMCVGNAAAAKVITQDRVVDSLFDPHFYVSIILQATVHITTCAAAWRLAINYDDRAGLQKMDGPFKPNLVNTAIFLINTVQHASTFLGNYEGAPFLKSWTEFKILSRTLVAYVLAIFFVALEISPQLNSLLKLVPMPNKRFHVLLLGLMVCDLVGASAVGILSTMWGRRKQTKLRSRI